MKTCRQPASLRPRTVWSLALLLVCGCAEGGTVFVADPTGDRVQDRNAVAMAFERARPGDVVQFGPGTYLIGGEPMIIGTPGISLRGHAEGTTLLGCSREERTEGVPCGGFLLAGEAQHVSGLRFEVFRGALWVLDPEVAGLAERDPAFVGGQVLEDNHFEEISSVYLLLDADSTVYFRRNVFRNSWHPIVAAGRNIHVLDNELSVPSPEDGPGGHPDFGIAAAPNDGVCESILIEGNRIDGHSTGVMFRIDPNRDLGATCSDITVRDNDITLRPIYMPEVDPRVPESEWAERAGKLAIAPAIRLQNLQSLAVTGLLVDRSPPEGGWPPEMADARMHDITVEGNRIVGAVGVAIEVADVTDSRIIDNEIEVRPATSAEEIEALTNAWRPGLWVRLGLVEEVNGSPVWVSEGSRNVVVRNPR